MDFFTIRLKNQLFPNPPQSYATCISDALKKAGVHPKTNRRVSFVSVSIAAASVAASVAMIVLGAVLYNQSIRIHQRNSVETDPQQEQDTVSIASAQPDWNGTTEIIAAADPDGIWSEDDADRCGRVILSFLHNCGESEPDELWILRIRPMYDFLPVDDTASYLSSVLVLAQSRFGESDGPDLYCVQSGDGGKVLWGTQDGSLGPQRVLGELHDVKRWILFGTNTNAEGTLGHVKSCYLTGGEEGTDIEFSAFLASAESRKPFESSRHADCLSEYYLNVVGEPDLDYVLSLSLLLVTEQSNYAFSMRDDVTEVNILSASDADKIGDSIVNLPVNTAHNGETSVYNLSNQPLDEAESYAEAILMWLKSRGIEPDELWICGAAPFSFPEEEPTDDAYVLAMYEFEGETGPELFYYRNESILWQSIGYDPYCINTVYDPIKKQNCAFGFSAAYDNGPLAMKSGQLILEYEGGKVFADDSSLFHAEIPLSELTERLSDSKHKEWMRECFICPYPAELRIVECLFTVENGTASYSPMNGENKLQAFVPEPTE